MEIPQFIAKYIQVILKIAIPMVWVFMGLGILISVLSLFINAEWALKIQYSLGGLLFTGASYFMKNYYVRLQNYFERTNINHTDTDHTDTKHKETTHTETVHKEKIND